MKKFLGNMLVIVLGIIVVILVLGALYIGYLQTTNTVFEIPKMKKQIVVLEDTIKMLRQQVIPNLIYRNKMKDNDLLPDTTEIKDVVGKQNGKWKAESKLTVF